MKTPVQKNSHSPSFIPRPLHLSQQEVYREQITIPSNPQFNVGGYIVFKGNFNLANCFEIVNNLPVAFDIFRVNFDFSKEEPSCYFEEEAQPFDVQLKSFENHTDPEKEALTWMQGRFNTAFQLNGEKLYEQFVIKISEDEHWWYLRCHHLITDGYGFSVIAQYFANEYN